MSFIKALTPDWLLRFIRPYYHGFVAVLASYYFGQPSKKMLVVGITGTAGKSTTSAMVAAILNGAGKTAGYITTVNFFDGKNNYINKHGLSMPGGWLLQKQLRHMLGNGCKYAIVECTSEGLAQNRHFGIRFGAALVTNLSEAHVEAHGGFGNYLKAKQKLFRALKSGAEAGKIIGVNLDDPYWQHFSAFPTSLSFGITLEKHKFAKVSKIYAAENIQYTDGLKFNLQGTIFSSQIFGQFNLYNALLAAACANMLGVVLPDAAASLKDFTGVPGRMEAVGNNRGIKIFVDYGCEPASFLAALKSAAALPHKNLIHVFGSTGGHRDVKKRFIFGKISAQFADRIIITNDDVYGSDPREIANNIESGIRNQELWKGRYEIILDRREAIAKALSMAQKDDLVLITGKGSEQFLVLPENKRIAWDERSVVVEELSRVS